MQTFVTRQISALKTAPEQIAVWIEADKNWSVLTVDRSDDRWLAISITQK